MRNSCQMPIRPTPDTHHQRGLSWFIQDQVEGDHSLVWVNFRLLGGFSGGFQSMVGDMISQGRILRSFTEIERYDLRIWFRHRRRA